MKYTYALLQISKYRWQIVYSFTITNNVRDWNLYDEPSKDKLALQIRVRELNRNE